MADITEVVYQRKVIEKLRSRIESEGLRMQAVGHYPNLEDVAVAKIVDNDFKTVTFIQITIGGIIRELVSPVVTQKGTISLYAHDGEWKTSDVYKECSDVEVKSKKKGKGKKNDSKKL